MASFTTWALVRDLAGVRLNYVYDEVPYGTPDGALVNFYIKNHYLCDYNADGAVSTADVTVRDDGVAVAVSAIDANAGKITLAAAPAAASDMRVDYAWSPVKETSVDAAITRAEGRITKRCRTGPAASAFTQYWDGNGYKTRFMFDRIPVTSITSYDIDGTVAGLTAGTDYWIYPNPTRGTWIEFASAPASDHQNVQITYAYGETNQSVIDLATHIAARTILVEDVARGKASAKTQYRPTEQQGKGLSEGDKHYSLIKRIDEEIVRLWEEVGGQLMIDVV